jgi:hypothetical protein
MSDNIDIIDPKDKSRVRSPNFPYINLKEAVQKVEAIYKQDKRNATSADVLLGHLGYKQAHGSSRRVLSALRQYGLLEERSGGLYRVSDLAYRIIHTPVETIEQKALLIEAAQKPILFFEILSIYEADLPSDPTLKSYLILNKGFNPSGADLFIRVLKETVEYANLTPEDFSGSTAAQDVGRDSGSRQVQQNPTQKSFVDNFYDSFMRPHPVAKAQEQKTDVPKPEQSVLVFKISQDSEAQIIFNGIVTQEAIAKLTALLELSRDTFPSKAELNPKLRPVASAQQFPSRAIWRNKDVDQPITVIDRIGSGHDGRDYLKIEGSDTAIPEDEVRFIE